MAENQTPYVKKVQAVETVEEETVDTVTETSSDNRLFGRLRGGLSAAFNTAKNGVKSGFDYLKENWFGAKTVVKAGKRVTARTASLLNVSKKVAAVGLATVVLGTSVAGGVFISNAVNYNRRVRHEQLINDCSTEVMQALSASTIGNVGDVSEQKMMNAEMVWAVGKAFGLTDEQCAGLLGQMESESGIDPTIVEGYYSEPYSMPVGGRKSALFDAVNPNVLNNAAMDDHFIRDISGHVNPNNWRAYWTEENDGTHYCVGLGMLQWTGPGAASMQTSLLQFASANGLPWYDFSLQLAFMVCNNGDPTSHPQWHFTGFRDDQAHAHSVRDAMASALGYLGTGKGRPDYDHPTFEQRVARAEAWYNRFSARSQEIYQTYSSFADTIVGLAGSASFAAAANYSHQAMDECQPVDGSSFLGYDNSGIAQAAVAFAWKTKTMGEGNNGTQLYRAVFNTLWSYDGGYMDCGHAAATAIVWSGADDNFPFGDTSNQDLYLSQEALIGTRWVLVGDYDTHWQELQPGDVVVTTRARLHEAGYTNRQHGHISIYVGVEITQAKYPDTNTEFVAAAYQERSPTCMQYKSSSEYNHHGYRIYRYVGPYDGVRGAAYTGNDSGFE